MPSDNRIFILLLRIETEGDEIYKVHGVSYLLIHQAAGILILEEVPVFKYRVPDRFRGLLIDSVKIEAFGAWWLVSDIKESVL